MRQETRSLRRSVWVVGILSCSAFGLAPAACSTPDPSIGASRAADTHVFAADGAAVPASDAATSSDALTPDPGNACGCRCDDDDDDDDKGNGDDKGKGGYGNSGKGDAKKCADGGADSGAAADSGPAKLPKCDADAGAVCCKHRGDGGNDGDQDDDAGKADCGKAKK